jgi:hypothetical protein
VKKKRFLFYLVHPAKFHFHKVQIHELKRHGHEVDIVINTKDILEDLVREEGWEYTNIFPESRKIRGVHVYVSASVNLFRSVYRLWRFARGKEYDLFIGDALTYLGRLRCIPSLYPTDNDLASVPEQRTWFMPADYIIAPLVTDLGRFAYKKIAYSGYKALAHLHPNHFSPDESRLPEDLRGGAPFYLIRCTGFKATHDIRKSGISDDLLFRLKEVLEPHGRILITSERKLPGELEGYRLNIRKNDITHCMAYASMFIGDSTTMAAEAAVLGTPAVEFDEYFPRIRQMAELEGKYGLVHCFRTNQAEEFLGKVVELMKTPDIKEEYRKRRLKLLDDAIDVSAFLVWIYEEYPESKNEFLRKPAMQQRYK